MSIVKKQQQAIFNKVFKHLFKQGKRAASLGNTCFYRYNGLKCAIGCLIPDRLYTKTIEGRSIFNLDINNLGIKYTGDISFLHDLQREHDIWFDETDKTLIESMFRIAENYELDPYPVLVAVTK